MQIIVLGGAGAMGRIAVRTLTEFSDVDQINNHRHTPDHSRQRSDPAGHSHFLSDRNLLRGIAQQLVNLRNIVTRESNDG